MSRKGLRTLAVIVVALFAILYFVETDDVGKPTSALLVPDLKSRLNDVTAITVERAGEDAPIEIQSSEAGWRVPGRGGYPASVAKIREALLAIADAEIVEEKTSNPERYGQLGVQGPDADGADSTLITMTTPDVSYALILGKSAPGGFRYARIPDEARSVLIDADPQLPQSAGEWLLDDVLDIKAAVVQSVVIEHADGETIRIGKSDRETTDFAVFDIPEGRELSYATVANGMAGALASLTLDDVRKDAGGAPVATATFETFEGLRIRAEAFEDGDDTWFRFAASESPAAPADAGQAAGADDAETGEAEAEAESPEGEPAESAESINARLGGWQYLLPDYKKNLLLRRWDDILKTQ